MRRRFVTLAAMSALALALSASPALASGPATSHRGIVVADCGGQTYSVAVENAGQNIGAAQVVDGFGHAVLVSGTSTVIDTTTSTVLGSWVSAHGGGHDNQTQTLCVSIQTYLAGDVFAGGPLPDGVAASDTISYEVDFWVVLKV